MQKFKILVAETIVEKEMILSGHLRSIDNVAVIGTYNNTNNILNVLKVTDVDVLVVDLFMPNFDGINLLETLYHSRGEFKKPKRVIVITSFISSYINNRLNSIGIDYLLMKPVNLDNLTNIVKEMQTQVIIEEDIKEPETKEDIELDAEITEILHEVGVPAHIKGYMYLREAILLVIENVDFIGSITKTLYPASSYGFAKRVTTIPTSTERTLKHNITTTHIEAGPQSRLFLPIRYNSVGKRNKKKRAPHRAPAYHVSNKITS